VSNQKGTQLADQGIKSGPALLLADLAANAAVNLRIPYGVGTQRLELRHHGVQNFMLLIDFRVSGVGDAHGSMSRTKLFKLLNFII
jgi:hypothetical protein